MAEPSDQQLLLQAIIELFQAEHRPLHAAVVAERLKANGTLKRSNLENEVSRALAREESGENPQFERVASNTYRLAGYDWSNDPERWQSQNKQLTTDFRLLSIEAINFRSFETLYLELANQFTLIVGENGAGKTALLDAIATGVSVFFGRVGNAQPRSIESDDVRIITNYFPNSTTREQSSTVVLSCRALIESEETFWTISRVTGSRNTQRRSVHDLRARAEQLQEDAIEGKPVTLPLLAYYGTGRLWSHGAELKDVPPQTPQSRFAGYHHWLRPFSQEKQLIEWFSTRTFSALQEQRKDPELLAVQDAIRTCLPSTNGEGWQHIEYNIQQGELVAFNENRSDQLPFRLLSDGYRNWIAMIADIARRTVMLNPHLGERAIAETPGIVLIDEIDLHLHPKWQRRIVDDLKRTFPQLQFVATTHSPFIIQSLRDGELVMLDSDDPVEYVDQSIEDIAENVMGVENPQRSRRYQQKVAAAKEYSARLEENSRSLESSEAKDIQAQANIDELITPFSDDPAYQALLEIQRIVTDSKKAK